MIRNGALWAIAAALLCTSISSAAGPAQAVIARDGGVRLARGSTTICQIDAGLYDVQWRSAAATADTERSLELPAHALRLMTPGRQAIRAVATIVEETGQLRADYRFTPETDVVLNSLNVSAEFTVASLAGGHWQADDRQGTFPGDFGDVVLFNGSVRKLQVVTSEGQGLAFGFPESTNVLIQDNRQWGPTFVVRIQKSSTADAPFRKDVEIPLSFALSAEGGIAVEHDAPVTIVAGDEWIPLDLQLDIEPGSVLDLSHVSPHGAPAGKHGWLLARDDGTFRFEQRPDQPARFYGVNLCFSSQYLTHPQSDQLAERLVRLGYNTVRLHHYESELTENTPDRTRLNPQKLDQLDYLFAALTKRGIYVTTDLYVSRPVRIESLLPGFAAARRDSMNAFKTLAVIHDQAYENWKTFSRNLLTHVNPYTGRAYKDDPGLAWLSLINEGNLGNFVSLAREIPDFRRAWNAWLAQRYSDRAALAQEWGQLLHDDEDPEQGTVRLEGNIYGQEVRGRDLVCFLADVDRDFFRRAAKFLREELGVRALLTNMNAWTNPVVTQQVRCEMDYVDDHFYVDHPEFVEQSWRLPSRCPNTSPMAGGAGGGRHITFTRLFDRPFTLTEYNYSGPGRYRGVGGILTGAMGALQDWGAIWRFAYGHGREELFQPERMDYFNMVSDPLSQAAERASICLFLRGDMQRAPHSATIAMTPEDWRHAPPRVPNLAPSWHWAAWITRVGTSVITDSSKPLPQDLVLPLGWKTPGTSYAAKYVADAGDPYSLSQEKVLELLRQRKLIDTDNPTAPQQNVYQSETREVTIDAPRDTLTLDTPRTAGGFAPDGQAIRTRHGLSASIVDVPATVWVSAMDSEPIARSHRLLVTHLTDLQNTEIRYAERARQTLLDWGRLPHLVRAGKAEIRLHVADPQAYRVWAVSTGGTRVIQVPARAEGSELVFTADVQCAPDHGAILCYEVAR